MSATTDHKTIVSVILPVYNGAAFLRESIDSILAQTFRDLELIIIDDGSTDATAEIVFSYRDNRVRFLQNEVNLGLIESLNKGLRTAKGEFIARMDADDVAFPQRLEKQLEIFRSNSSVLVCGSNYAIEGSSIFQYRSKVTDNDYLKSNLLFATCFSHPTVMMRNVFKKLDIWYDPAYRHAEDYRLWTTLAQYGEFAYIDEPLIKYRRHSGQVSVVHSAAQQTASRSIRETYLETLGFEANAREKEIHNATGENALICSTAVLVETEKWLTSLLEQNRQLGRFEVQSFNSLIHKYWFDCCGNTTLGFRAYMKALTSPLTRLIPLKPASWVKLFAKCMKRWRPGYKA
jgi:glycosyltransferase involved in cell wall biosynthesis